MHGNEFAFSFVVSYINYTFVLQYSGIDALVQGHFKVRSSIHIQIGFGHAVCAVFFLALNQELIQIEP